MNTVSLPNPTQSSDALWRDDAACSETNPELFFAGDDRSVAAAKALCESCPVRAACLEAAIQLGEMHGIWGGMSEGERRRLIRSRRRDARQARAEQKAA